MKESKKGINKILRFQLLTVVSMDIIAFWDTVIPP
jgi:hypothetical protein